MAPWIRRPHSSSGRRVAPAPTAYDQKRQPRTPDQTSTRHRARSAGSSRNVPTSDKGYNGQTITYRVFNGRTSAPGVKSKPQQKTEVTKEDTKSKYSRRSSNTVEGTVDSIPTRDESSSSDIKSPVNPYQKGEVKPPTERAEPQPRNTYSSQQRARESNSRPRSAGPSYTRPTISATYQRPWQTSADSSRPRPSSASAARSAPTNPILANPDDQPSQTHERPEMPTVHRAPSSERGRPQPERSQPTDRNRAPSSERSRPQPEHRSQPTDRNRAPSTERSRPEVKPVTNGNGVKCYPLAVHLQNTAKTPLVSNTPPPVSSQQTAPTSTKGSGKENGVLSERAHLEQLLCSSRPKDRSTTDFYSFGEVVGTGSFAKVRLAVHKLTGQRVAIKTYEKNKIKDSHALKRISQEIKLMERLDHPLISRFFEAIESARRIHIVMELIGEGNLCSYIKDKKFLPEDEARGIFSQLCSAVEYLHSQHIIHRDIKLEVYIFPRSELTLVPFVLVFSLYCSSFFLLLNIYC